MRVDTLHIVLTGIQVNLDLPKITDNQIPTQQVAEMVVLEDLTDGQMVELVEAGMEVVLAGHVELVVLDECIMLNLTIIGHKIHQKVNQVNDC